MENSCLENWFNYSYSLLYGQDFDYAPPCTSIKEQIDRKRLLKFGIKAFSLPSCSSMSCLEIEIRKYFGLNVILDRQDSITEILLIFCVSEHCEYQKLFLEQILELNEDIQMQLMIIIKNTSFTFVSEESRMLISTQANSDSYGSLQTCSGSMQDIYCMACELKESTIATLRQQLSDQISQERQAERQMKDCLLQETSKTVNVELSLLQKEEVLREKDKVIAELNRRISESDLKVNNLLSTASQLCQLQDEVIENDELTKNHFF